MLICQNTSKSLADPGEGASDAWPPVNQIFFNVPADFGKNVAK